MNEDPQIAIRHTGTHSLFFICYAPDSCTSTLLKVFGVDANCSDHCIDYIRQALMCHGDVTPIPLYWKEYDESGAPTRYETNWEVTHTCRNWDVLYKWALAGNNTGWHI